MSVEKGKKTKDELGAMEIKEGEDENPERGNWTGQLDFLLSCLGYAVGLGNVWRFPYLCFKNGGGSFLIPYTLMLLLIGIPCFLLELNIGQYTGLGPVTLYSKWAPLFKGLGFANFMSQTFVGLYYNMIIAWTIYYLFASFQSHLPWQDCTNDFNDEFCFSITDYKDCTDQRLEMIDGIDGLEKVPNPDFNPKLIYMNHACLDVVGQENIRKNLTKWYGSTKEIDILDDMNMTMKKRVDCIYINTTFCDDSDGAIDTITDLFDIPVKIRASSSGQYLSKSVLQESTGIHDMGTPLWGLALCLLAAWIVIFLCLMKGIKSSGKVVYFTATFPYFVLFILLIRAVTLPGANLGIRFYLIPEWSRLADIKVWEGAAVQIFFSLSVAGGGLVTLSSYNKFHNNILRDTMIVCIGNCLTSFVAGFAIFSVLGFMATELGVDIVDVAKSGTGLAFEAYPDLVTRLPLPQLWAVLFFLMLFTLGLDSQFAIVETILTGILDFKPSLRPKKTLVVAAVCIVGFIVGLPLTCPGGPYLLDLLDYYAASWPYLFIGLMELVIVSYVYGYDNYVDDLYEMTRFSWVDKGLRMFMKPFYLVISPLVIFIIFCFSWANYEPLKKGDYVYPPWANGVGWILAMTCILPVPGAAIYSLVKGYMTKNQHLDDTERLKATAKELLEPKAEFRANAIRAAKRDESEGKFSYHDQDGKVLRMRRRGDGSGFDNPALNIERM